jgi:hypothetical protein
MKQGSLSAVTIRKTFLTITIATLASTNTLTADAWAAKEKFVRDKPHVNIGTIGASGIVLDLVDANETHTATTDENGEFWFEGLTPGAKRVFVGSLSAAGHPPDPGKIFIENAYVATLGGSHASKTSKPKEIVVVGSKSKPGTSRTAEWTDHNGADPGVTKYEIREDEDGNSTLTFGDGQSGQRLPTGVENITAEYRAGGGTEGAVGDPHKKWSDLDNMGGASAGAVGDPHKKWSDLDNMGGASAGAVGDPHKKWSDLDNMGGPSAAQTSDGHKKWINLDSLSYDDPGGLVVIRVPPEASGDSFFDIFVDVGVSSMKGRVLLDSDSQPARPTKPDLPDRPEKIDRPDLPTRPIR